MENTRVNMDFGHTGTGNGIGIPLLLSQSYWEFSISISHSMFFVFSSEVTSEAGATTRNAKGYCVGTQRVKGRAQTTLHLLRQIEIRIPKDEIAHPYCLNSRSFDVFMDWKQFRINSA